MEGKNRLHSKVERELKFAPFEYKGEVEFGTLYILLNGSLIGKLSDITLMCVLAC
jgi:hypothetical protein